MTASHPLTRRRALFAGAAALASWSPRARPSARMPRLGFITGVHFPELEQAFSDELRRLGLVENRDFTMQRRFTRPNSSDGAEMGRELATSDLSLLIVSSLPLALIARDANPRMPMVIGTCPGMVSNGFAQTLRKPGGIYTGIDELPPGVTARRLRLLKQAAPAVSRVALLSTTPGRGGHEAQLADAQGAARELGIEVKPYRATTLAELHGALEAIRADGMDGLQNFQGALSLMNRDSIIEQVTAARIAAIYQALPFAHSGGLMTWAPVQADQMRIAARMTARILAGESPGDIPVEYPPQYYLTLNAGAASRIGLTFPGELVGSADRVLARAGPPAVRPKADGARQRIAPA
jgi:putative ABC transport system substrate-binding protein